MSYPPPSFAGLSPAEKRMLLAELLREKAKQDSSLFPLAHGQRGLWFLYQLDHTSPAYNIFFPARIRSRLDIAAFRRTLQTLIDRHPSLRTTFEQHDGELLQQIHEKLPVCLEVHDATAWDEEFLRQRIEEETYRPFDLERGPLVRMYLFTRSSDEHVFLLTAHHIIGDFWSMVLAMEETHLLYAAERDGHPSALAPLTSQYRDFVRWQTDLLAGPEGERLESYWMKQLEGVPPVLEMPTDCPRPPRFTHHGAAVPCRLGAELVRRLRALAAAEGVTPYTILLAAFQALLGRCTGQEDFVVGSPFAGRSRTEFEKVIGYFSNMLPLCADLSADPTFRVLLGRVGSAVLGALQHQDYPFSLLVERLNLPRDPSRPPLVQASFTLERAHRPAGVGTWGFFLPRSDVRLSVAGLHSEPYHLKQRTCQLDLEMVLEEGDGTVFGMLRYNADLFDEDTIGRMVGHYQTLLEGAINDPDCRLSELPLLTPGEERQVLHEWNDTRADYPRDVCLHQLFEQQAARTPEAVALRFGEQSIRYAELDAWANRLAHRLRLRGVGPNTLVALCLERSPEMVAAIFAVLKAGGVYVPLDPTSPAERLRTVLADTRAPILLTQPHLKDRLPVLETEVICLDSSLEDGEESALPPVSGVQPDDLAYVIYTSGSTGRPKGVMVEHRAICNTVFWHWKTLNIRADDRLLLAVPYQFDASICLLFPALAAGACLVLAEPCEDRDPDRLLERVVREAVTVLPVLPRMLQLMLDGPMEDAARTLRWVCSGGETMPPELPARLFDVLDVPLYNLYGPTEVAVDATYWTCRCGENRSVIPIGCPIANVQVYVLDRHRQPVPVGVPGELYVGGAGLARGYLNDPQLTAERFIPDPFRTGPDARLYRTGDRCRWLADGSLEFLGRLDQQVKVRGHRVEIGEIETVLMSHPAVRESAVVLLDDEAGGQRLAAYVTARPGEESPSVESLRRHVKERLPEYMVPSHFMVLAELPHTSNGKVDRKALPAPVAARPATTQPFVPPRSPLEELIAGLWCEVLRLDRLGVLDNFFELGGNSIQAAVLIHRLQEKLGRPIYTVALFDSPTIAGLAGYLVEVASADGRHPPVSTGHSPLLVSLQPNGSRPPLFMVHPPGGIVVCYQPLAHRLGQDRPFYGIRARGLHGETDLPARLEDMAAEYVAAMRGVQAEGPYHLGGWSVGGVVAFEMARQLVAQGQPVGLLALLDSTLPLNPTNPRYAEGAELSAREYGLDITLEELDRLGPDEQLPYLWQHVQRLGLVEADTPLPLVQQILDDLKRLFHAHICLANDYEARPYAGRIAMFRPSDSPVAGYGPQDRGWGEWAQTVDVHLVPGQHHTMVKEPHVQMLARQLNLCLRQAEETRCAN